MHGYYNLALVAASLLAAILTACTALEMGGRVVSSQGRAAHGWLAGGALAMGLGMWSTHFIGMLALRLPIRFVYDPALTACSLLAAVLVSALALWLASRPVLPLRRLAPGALLLGSGIALMHYIGMAALRIRPAIEYRPGGFALSIAAAVVAAAAALHIVFRQARDGRRPPLRLRAAAALGAAIAGMHYTGMAAARFAPGSVCGAAIDGLHGEGLALAASLLTLAVTGAALGMASMDRKYRSQAESLVHSLDAANRELVNVALCDPLTRLPNRVLLLNHVQFGIEDARRERRRLAVMLLDLDGFKSVNDSHGHAAGDELLVAVAERGRAMLRAQDTFARLGGDEFALSLAVSAPEDAAALAGRLAHALAQPFRIGRRELHVSASIGISIYPDDADDERQLMANADAAMRHVKAGGRNGFAFFDHSMDGSAHGWRLMQELPVALKQGQFALDYQPIYAAAGQPPIGVEALLRWHHPEFGSIQPDLFIPLAERVGLIVPLGEWALDAACRQIAAWRQAGHGEWHVSVNLSAVQLGWSGLLDSVRDTLARHAVPPRLLTLEVTESAFMRDAEACLQALRRLAEMGIRISIDDFGTGYCSLLYLKRLPARELKIDRSFVRDIEHADGDAAIVGAIVALARSLDLAVVAEGVETAGQLERLRQLGCTAFQGYLLGVPMSAGRCIDGLSGTAAAA